MLAIVSCSFLLPLQYANAQSWGWATQSGGNCAVTPYSAVTDKKGNVYIVGGAESHPHSLEDSVSFDAQTFQIGYNTDDFFLVKYDPNGKILWAKVPISQYLSYYANSIVIDAADNIYVAGGYESSVTIEGTTLTTADEAIFLIKYNPDGNMIWAKNARANLPGTVESPNALACDPGCNIYLAASTADNNYTYRATLLVKCDSAGNELWETGTRYTGFEFGKCVNTDRNGNVYIIGECDSSVSFGNYTLSGSDTQSTAFLVKYDSSGNVLWAKADSSWTDGTAVVCDRAGNIYVTGSEINLIYLLKYDADGNKIWKKSDDRYPKDIKVSYPYDMAIDPAGNVYITGWFDGSVTIDTAKLYGYSLFLLKFDSSGSIIWAWGAGNEYSLGSALACDNDGNCYFAGRFNSFLQLGPNPLFSNADDNPMFLTKFYGTVKSHIGNTTIIYPNPTSSMLKIEAAKITDVTIINTLGKSIFYQQVNSDVVNIDVSALPFGVYFVKINGSEVKKFVKE